MAAQSYVFIGVKGTVLALDQSTGQEAWRRRLDGADFVNVTSVGGDLYATTRGEIFALEPWTGEIRWHNPLKGLGRGLVTIASAQQVPPMEAKRRRDAAASAAGAAAA